MGKKGYEWVIGGSPPKIELHSLTKHRVYEEYLQHYLQVLNASPMVREFRLSVVDGFAGGGLYRHPVDGNEHPGSPLKLIRACEAAAAGINVHRQQQGIRTPLELDVDYYFVEKDPNTFNHLRWYLAQEGIGSRFDQDVHLVKGEFAALVPGIIKQIEKKGRAGRALFFLDQYGYSEVPFPLIRSIFGRLPHAEIILTFAVDWLIDYMTNDPSYLQTLDKIGLRNVIDIGALLDAKEDCKDWRRLAQITLHSVLPRQAGANYYTPFFVVSSDSKRALWLIHLSTHHKARDVMTELHWKIKNHFAHYAGVGIRMFGYDPGSDIASTGMADLFENRSEYRFDEVAEQRTNETLLDELPAFVTDFENGIRFKELYARVANSTPATAHLMRTTIKFLENVGELEVRGLKGERRKKAYRIHDDDVIKPAKQRTFSFPGKDRLSLIKDDA